MKVDLNNYDYVMFVDASGDDGVKFDRGSSICYAVGGYLVRREDIPNDLSTLRMIRQSISGNPDTELKYSTLRRHKNREKAFRLFSNLRGRALTYVSFKKILLEASRFDTEGKAFSVVAHTIAITLLNKCPDVRDKRVLIVVDRMKNTEEKPVQMIADTQMQESMDSLSSYDLIFRDSKDSQFQLIQVADFISGIAREYFERYETDPDMISFWRLCFSCCKSTSLNLCGRHGSRKRISLINGTNLKYLLRMFPARFGLNLMSYLMFDPPELIGHLFYFYCPKI